MSVLNFFKDKRVLVTGNTGFKGSWLTIWLLQLGAKVAGLSVDIPTQPSLYAALNLENDIEQYWEDLRNPDSVKAAFAAFKPDLVFHLAAQPIVKTAYEQPHLTFETNVMGMVNVLEAIREAEQLQAAVLITSDKCYENVEWPYGYREIDHLGGKDPYSASKGCAELVAHAYWHSFFTNNEHMAKLATTRAGNVIGGGDWAVGRLIPDILRAWVKEDKLIIRSPHATRPWQHVLEPLSGYLCLAEDLAKSKQQATSKAYNFGPREDTVKSVGQVVHEFAQFWPQGQWAVEENKNMKEASLLKLDCSKARHELNWQAVMGFPKTIEFTAQWYQRYYQGNAGLKDFTLQQIDQYVEFAQARELAWALGK